MGEADNEDTTPHPIGAPPAFMTILFLPGAAPGAAIERAALALIAAVPAETVWLAYLVSGMRQGIARSSTTARTALLA